MANIVTSTNIGTSLYVSSSNKLEARDQLRGINYITVYGKDTEINNGYELFLKLDIAKNSSPNGQPLSSFNRMTVLVAPGRYTLPSFVDYLEMDTPYVELVSLTGEADVFLSSQTNNTAIRVISSDIKIKGFNLSEQSQRIIIDDSYSDNYFENIIGGNGNFTAGNAGYSISGNFKNCTGGDYSFADADNGEYLVYSTLENCYAGMYSFGYGIVESDLKDCSANAYSFGNNTIANSSNLTNCMSFGGYSFGSYISITDSTLTNCTSGEGSFANQNYNAVISNSILTGCKGLDSCFGWTIEQSTLTDCTSGAYSFGKNQIRLGSTLINCSNNSSTDSFGCEDGIYESILKDCSSGGFSFGRTNVPGQATSINDSQLTNCIAGPNSFAVDNGGNNTFTNCIAGQESFGTNTAYAAYKNCKGGDNSFGAGLQGWPDLIAGGVFTNCEALQNSFGTNYSNGNFYSCIAGVNSFVGNNQGGMGGFAAYTKGMYPGGLGTAIYCVDSANNPINFGLGSTTNNI